MITYTVGEENKRICATTVANYAGQQITAWGLSTDTKPLNLLPNASVFFEMDTGSVSLYDEENTVWLPQ